MHEPVAWRAVIPRATLLQLDRVCHTLREAVGPPLLGLYAHGSLVMGCFNPVRSDLDLLVVTTHGMTVETKRDSASILLDQSLAPHPIEISFLRHGDVLPWQFPTPYDLHYSETWRARYQSDLESGAWQRWNETRHRGDPDLAAHITILRSRGVRLYGSAIAEVFPPVPPDDYLASILGDAAAARDEIVRDPVYGILNLCRVYWYLRDGQISSKEEAGAWAMSAVPAAFQPVVRQALEAYHGGQSDQRFASDEITTLAEYLDGRIQALYRAR